MKEAGIEITFRQSFFSDPAVPVKNLKVRWLGVVGTVCRETRWVGKGGGLERRARQEQVVILVLRYN